MELGDPGEVANVLSQETAPLAVLMIDVRGAYHQIPGTKTGAQEMHFRYNGP